MSGAERHLDRYPESALVTGAGQRLGQAMALELAAQGYRVALHYNRSRQDAEGTAEEIRKSGGQAVLFQADLSSEAETSKLAEDVNRELGPLGVLINNAATFVRDEWDDTTRDSWDLHMEPNLRAPFVLAQAMARNLPEERGGLVINLLDQRVWNLTPHFISYTLSKSGLWTLTRTLALSLAPRIRVNAIGPGPTLPSPNQTQEQFNAQVRKVPLRRGPDMDEIRNTLTFLLGAGSVTGQMIALDGGQHLGWGQVN